MTTKSKVDEIGEGDCSIQCWICPFCFDDHGYDKTDCKPVNLILTIGDLRAELQTLKSAIRPELQDVARKAFEAGREIIGRPTYSAYTGVRITYTYPTFEDYEKSLSDKEQKIKYVENTPELIEQAKQIIKKHAKGFEYLSKK
jgi:hypothetical protein